MHVVIVGTGPSGLILSLLLAKAGIKVTLLDAASTIDDRPRAAHYAPSAIRVLRDAGVLEDVRREGFIPREMIWRKQDGTPIAGLMDTVESRGEDGLTVLPLNMLGKVILGHAEKEPLIEILWEHKVVDVGQDEGSAWADVELKDGERKRVKGDYLSGCDGANSRVRKSLFGDEFKGKTWDAQIVATNVYYPLHDFGFTDINNIIHHEDYYMAAIISKDGMWRVSYGEDPNLSYEEVLANQPAKYERMLPGNPKPGDYKITNVGPYRIHQRCAEAFRVGRITLAADAAHLVNPFGGMGLTGGIVDVGGLAECLIGIEKGLADDSILDLYSEKRMEKWRDYIDPISSDNFLRVSATDPEDPFKTDKFLAFCKEMENDETGEMKRDFDLSVYDICHDFKQYYRKTPAPTDGVHGVEKVINGTLVANGIKV